MNLQFFLEKLYSSQEFKQFKGQNPDAFPCSAFFVIDKGNLENPDNKYHFDYYVPNNKKIFSFQLERGVKFIPIESFEEKIPEQILINYDFDFKDIEKMIFDEMEKQGIKNKVQKILLSLQNLDKKDFFVGTVFISTFGLLKVNIDISEKKITNFSKKSFFDMMKVMKKGKDKPNQ